MSQDQSEITAHVNALEPQEDPLDLIVRLARGERSALAEMYDRHSGELRSFARRLVGDSEAAEDLVHDVFLALPRAVARFEGRSTLRTFLFAIAVRHCQNHVRAATRRRNASERLARELRSEAHTEEPHDARLASALTRGLDSLPLDQRLAFVVCVIEERSSIEASVILNAPEATIRTRLHRAKQKLRDYLSKEGYA